MFKARLKGPQSYIYIVPHLENFSEAYSIPTALREFSSFQTNKGRISKSWTRDKHIVQHQNYILMLDECNQLIHPILEPLPYRITSAPPKLLGTLKRLARHFLHPINLDKNCTTPVDMFNVNRIPCCYLRLNAAKLSFLK